MPLPTKKTIVGNKAKREERAAAALRENLRKRKEQAKQREFVPKKDKE